VTLVRERALIGDTSPRTAAPARFLTMRLPRAGRTKRANSSSADELALAFAEPITAKPPRPRASHTKSFACRLGLKWIDPLCVPLTHSIASACAALDGGRVTSTTEPPRPSTRATRSRNVTARSRLSAATHGLTIVSRLTCSRAAARAKTPNGSWPSRLTRADEKGPRTLRSGDACTLLTEPTQSRLARNESVVNEQT
jgi:hypothetical protein